MPSSLTRVFRKDGPRSRLGDVCAYVVVITSSERGIVPVARYISSSDFSFRFVINTHGDVCMGEVWMSDEDVCRHGRTLGLDVETVRRVRHCWDRDKKVRMRIAAFSTLVAAEAWLAGETCPTAPSSS